MELTIGELYIMSSKFHPRTYIVRILSQDNYDITFNVLIRAHVSEESYSLGIHTSEANYWIFEKF